MSLKSLVVILGVTALLMLGTAPHAAAQAQTSPIAQPGESAVPPRYVRRRIEINPRPLLYRRCKDWYVIQYRPSGRVLFPQTHCWWVRG